LRMERNSKGKENPPPSSPSLPTFLLPPFVVPRVVRRPFILQPFAPLLSPFFLRTRANQKGIRRRKRKSGRRRKRKSRWRWRRKGGEGRRGGGIGGRGREGEGKRRGRGGGGGGVEGVKFLPSCASPSPLHFPHLPPSFWLCCFMFYFLLLFTFLHILLPAISSFFASPPRGNPLAFLPSSPNIPIVSFRSLPSSVPEPSPSLITPPPSTTLPFESGRLRPSLLACFPSLPGVHLLDSSPRPPQTSQALPRGLEAPSTWLCALSREEEWGERGGEGGMASVSRNSQTTA
jgi:hypothetical protein